MDEADQTDQWLWLNAKPVVANGPGAAWLTPGSPMPLVIAIDIEHRFGPDRATLEATSPQVGVILSPEELRAESGKTSLNFIF